MARFTHARNSFLLGEVSPASFGRTELPEYTQMCEMMKNMVPRIQGGATRRMGTRSIGGGIDTDATLNIDPELKLIPFKVTGPLTSLFVGVPKSGFLAMTQNNIKRVGFFPDGAGSALTVAQLGNIPYGISNGWSIATASSGWTPGTEQWAQFGDFIVIVNGLYRPLIVAANATGFNYFLWGEGAYNNNFGLDTTLLHRFFPYDTINVTATTMAINTASVGTGRTLTASTATFRPEMVQRFIRVYDSGTIGLAQITGYTNSTTVTVQVLQAFPGTSAYLTWAFSQWGGDRGWPRAVSFFEERLVFGGNTAFPDTVWCSQIADLYEMSLSDPTATATLSDAFAVTAGQSDAGGVNALFPKENLFALTEVKETYLDGIDDTISIGNGNTKIQSNSRRGASQYQPQGLDTGLCFIGGFNRILELSFAPMTNRGYMVTDLSSWTADITRDRALADPGIGGLPLFRTISPSQNPDLMLWAVDTSGRLYSVTRSRGEKADSYAWAHHELGGVGAFGGANEAKVIDICVIDNVLCLAVQRKIGLIDSIICYETIANSFVGQGLLTAAGALPADPPIYLDYSSKAVAGAPTTTFTGFTQLKNQWVQVIADGNYIGDFTIDYAGTLTLPDPYTSVIVGLNYESKIIPTCIVANALFGSGLGQIKRVEQSTILFERTVGAQIGVVGKETEEIDLDFRSNEDLVSDPIPLFTGEKTVNIQASYEGKQNIYVAQFRPYPMTVNAIIQKGILYD